MSVARGPGASPAKRPVTVTFPARVVPGAPRTGLDGLRGGALLIRLAAPAVEGQANEALRAFLAERLGVRKAQISIRAGQRSRDKVVGVEGMPAEAVRAGLSAPPGMIRESS